MASVLSKYKKADAPAPVLAAPIAPKPVAAPVIALVVKKPEVPKAVTQEPE